MTKEITKNDFKKLYFKYEYCDQNYWNEFYENERGSKYFFTEPTSNDQTRMFVVSENGQRRIVLMTEEAEEAFFDYPNKE